MLILKVTNTTMKCLHRDKEFINPLFLHFSQGLIEFHIHFRRLIEL